MTLFELLNEIEYDGAPMNSEVSGVTSDSRIVSEGKVFVAIKGLKFDGHDHAEKALKAGAVAVVCERDLKLPNQIIVKNSRSAYARLCSKIHGEPSKKLKLIGVTGTNGKTTTTTIIKQILEYAGNKCGLIGTIQNEIGEIKLPAKHTTPDPGELHVLFSKMVKAGCNYAVMEVSSHALDQHRLDGCFFEVGAFTNLTQDHLDYHKTMENYFDAKSKLFDMCRFGMLNLDDSFVNKLYETRKTSKDIECFSQKSKADLTATDVEYKADGVEFTLCYKNQKRKVNFAMPGTFSVENALAAVGCVLKAGIDFDVVASGLCACRGVKGRTEVLASNDKFTIICDYAHTPDGLEKILTTVKGFAKGRVVTLFGCAGERDRTKRKYMGEIVARYSDYVILTSDNPRFENPVQIIDDAVEGIKQHEKPYSLFVDRYEAINFAIDNAKQNDIIVLAGKGHEDYQVLDFGTIYFDEHIIVADILKEKGLL